MALSFLIGKLFFYIDNTLLPPDFLSFCKACQAGLSRPSLSNAKTFSKPVALVKPKDLLLIPDSVGTVWWQCQMGLIYTDIGGKKKQFWVNQNCAGSLNSFVFSCNLAKIPSYHGMCLLFLSQKFYAVGTIELPSVAYDVCILVVQETLK